MQTLTIEYHLDGMQPGYRFAPGSDPVDEVTRRAVWRSAMPRGQGWGDAAYRAARSIKLFETGRGQVAASAVRVTEMVDEMGRAGIRRAEVTLMRVSAYRAFVEASFDAYPRAVRQAAHDRLGSTMWRRVLNKALLRAQQQIVLAYPYHGPDDWQLVEALVMRLVTAPGVRWVEGWGTTPSFTTLALDWREESRVVALPLDRARLVTNVPVIRIP